MTRALQVALVAASSTVGALQATEATAPDASATFRQYCIQCHGTKVKMAGVSIDQLISQPSVGENFQQWQKVVAALEQNRMPPQKLKQPTPEERQGAVQWVRTRLNDYARQHAGDPGRVTVRRLTSAEYGYTISDLTGVDLKMEREFAGDAVGGEGFANFGDVQFMADANLERYLEVARKVADHAVIGAGPLSFFDNPGRSGFELSAITRINNIYAANGFRANAGEGGKPYGLDRYAKAFFVCWRYENRRALGEPKATVESIAASEGVSPRLAHHLLNVMHEKAPTYPTSTVVAKYKQLPAAVKGDREKSLAAGRKGADAVMRSVIDWPRWLFAAGEEAAGGQGDERNLALNELSLKPNSNFKFKFLVRTGSENGRNFHLGSILVNPTAKTQPVLLWRNAQVRYRLKSTKGFSPTQPLKAVLEEDSLKKVNFGTRPDGQPIGENDFVMTNSGLLSLRIKAPDDALAAELQVEAELPAAQAGDAVVRATVSDSPEMSKGRPISVLLADGKSAGFQAWKAHVLEFAAKLPQNSQSEAAPADKDPIPAPFDNTYNGKERDQFHAKVKYYRGDRFLVDNILDDANRAKLEQAWADLYSSFDYHNTFLRFIEEKYHLDLKKKTIADLDTATLESIPAEPRSYVKALKVEYDAAQKAELAGQPGQVDDALKFAEMAWRRPLSDQEKDRLRGFYVRCRESLKLDHDKAMRSLIARVLVSPAFLYRLEQTAAVTAKPIGDWELANRLSYFLWSSMPDVELRRAAAAGELSNPQQLEKQVKRMLADSKARRLSTEFFGQWLGFYRFDQYRGVDSGRFPEFTEEVKSAMYDEAVFFFDHIIRKDRPIREMLSADYTFLNQALAKHYGVKKEVKATDDPELVPGTAEFHRGGILRLGAVLTATSAPLRTSPVKRGDWVLRRILGTPTPPPPADAGSIPADDKLFAGLTVREKLASHKRNATCAGCHTRIDPLGFPLESYDAVGRWRDQYPDGKPIWNTGELPDNKEIKGVDGLVTYLKAQEPQVLRTFAYKMLGYALGRTVLASDQPLVDKLVQYGGDATFAKLATEIVLSKQFRYRREQEEAPAAPPKQVAASPQEIVDRPKDSIEKKGGL